MLLPLRWLEGVPALGAESYEQAPSTDWTKPFLRKQAVVYGPTQALSAPPKPFERLLYKFLMCHLNVACERIQACP